MTNGAEVTELIRPDVRRGGGRWTGVRRLMLVALAAVLVWLPPATLAAQVPAEESAYAEFEEALEPHGEWIEHERYGQVWAPYANEDRSWRPYTRGQWAYTEEHGWYWESEEEFGWATYHYGRWAVDDRYGWIWVPGNEWGPAWVAWRQGEDDVGWAPLPPEAAFDPYGDGTTFAAYDQASYAPLWVFVPVAMILAPRVWRHAFPPTRNRFYFSNTRHVTHYARHDRRVFNRGIDPRFVERRINRPIPVARIRQLDNPRARIGRGDGQSVGVYRPQLPPGGPAPRPGWRQDDRRSVPPREARGTPGGFGGSRDDRGNARAPYPDQRDIGRRDWRGNEPARQPRFERPTPLPPQGGRAGLGARPPAVAPPSGGHFGRASPQPWQRPSPPPAFHRAAPPPMQRPAPPQAQRQAPPQAQRNVGGNNQGGGRPNHPQRRPHGPGGR